MKKLLFTLFILTASCLMLLTACTECEVCSFGDWETVTEATCTAEGEKVRICSECQKEDRQPIEKKEHDLSLKETTLAATCTAEGKEKISCKDCDYSEERTVKATGHKETKAVIVEATCTQEGKDTYTCSVCNNVRETTTKKISHDYTIGTCKKPAACKNCGATSGITASHNYTEATCKKPATCTVCGATTGSKTNDHNFAEATCAKPKTCTVCGKTEGSKKDHDFGYSESKCKNCGYTPSATIQLPTLPQTLSNYLRNGSVERSCKITNISTEVYNYYQKDNEIGYTITLSGNLTYNYYGNNNNTSMWLTYKIYDSSGSLVKSDAEYTRGYISVGDNFEIEISVRLTPGKTYKLVLLDF